MPAAGPQLRIRILMAALRVPTLEMGGRGAAYRGRTGYRMGFWGPGRLDVQQRYAPAYYNPRMGIIHTSVVYCVWE